MQFTSPSNLVLVTHEFFPHRGGIAVFAAEMARAASRLGHGVEVWAPGRAAAGADEPAWPFAVKRLPMSGDHGLLSQWRMARELLAHRARLRHATLYIPEPGPLLSMLFLQYFKLLQPARLVLTLHGSEILRLASRPLTRWSTNRMFARADRISVVSRFARELMADRFPAHSSKVVVTPGALRPDFAAGSPVRTASSTGKIVILTVARLHPRKGQLRCLQALTALPAAQRRQIEYWIVGGHSKENYHRALEAAARAAGFPVKFREHVADDQLGSFYAQADIFAMTSMPHKLSVEGFGLVYLEAGAHHLPVIAHAIGGVPEAVAHEENGLLVPPDDLPGLTAAFARLIGDAALRRRLGHHGRARALGHTWLDAARTLFGPPTPPATA
ncbi:MAG: glycosyltransferase family 4 protein [Opitutae bacterium]|nr:glycosyltransferase family 4 protein [Opitutae bacterium]